MKKRSTTIKRAVAKKVLAVKKAIAKKTIAKKPTKNKVNKLAALITRFYQMQEHRIKLGNQIFQLKEAKQSVAPFDGYHDRFYEIEKDMAKYMEGEVKKHIMYDWLKEVKGIGPIISCALLSTIDIKEARHVSSVWKYAGLDVASDGQARSRRKEHLDDFEYVDSKGKKKMKKGITFNPFLKNVCWKIGESFVKSKGDYREIYDNSRKFYDKKFPKEVTVEGKNGKYKKYTKGHKYAMAKRRAVKLFLSDFWLEWRELEGLPVSLPYSHRLEKSDDPASYYNN